MDLSILATHRRVLLLQGPAGPFFANLSRYLRERDVKVAKVNFHWGDDLYYPRADFRYQGDLKSWRAWLEALLVKFDYDAVVVFGDCREYHRIALEVFRDKGLARYAMEEGYFRPDYFTLEKNGVNALSSIPREATYFATLPESYPVQVPTAEPFYKVAWYVSVYYTAQIFGIKRYPHYITHRLHSVPFEMRLWLKWAWAKKWRKLPWKDPSIVARCQDEWARKYFLVTLQLASDSQLRYHAEGKTIPEFLEEVLTSFKVNAHSRHKIVIKQHPLDKGPEDYEALVKRWAITLNIEDRVAYVVEGHLPTLLKNALGAVTLNSTSGLSALHHGVPVKTLATCFYDIPGLTFQGLLDDFWQQPGTVSYALYAKFRGYVVRNTQVNGSLYATYKGSPQFAAPTVARPLQRNPGPASS